MKKLSSLVAYVALAMCTLVSTGYGADRSMVLPYQYLYGTDDPTVVAKNAPFGTIYFNLISMTPYLKYDENLSTSWVALKGSSGGGTWGSITGTLSNQTDLQSALNGKEPTVASGLTTQYYRGDKTFRLLDTSAVPENVNLYYTQARFDSAFAAKSTSNLSEGTNLYFTNARVDTEFDLRLATKSTSNLAEGSNLYYTQGRFDSAFSAKSTTNLSEGTNLYFTNARVDTEFDTRLATKSTTNLAEGSNLYYTDTRVQTAAKNGTSAQILYVSKDAGNDAYDGSPLHPYKTIGAAITAANAIASYYKQVNIHVSPVNNGGSAGGNYNENVTFSQQGVNLICDNAAAYTRPCQVGGTLTVNLTGTSGGTNFIAASNEVTVTGFVFASGASNAVTFSGTTYQRFIAMNCYFQASAARSVVETNTGVSGSTPSEFRSYDTTFENNSSTIETVHLTAGRFWLYGTTGTVQNNNASGPSFLQDGPSSMIANIVQFTGQYQLTDNTATATFNLATIAAGTAACVSTPASPSTGYVLWSYAGCNSSNANAFIGTGVVVFATGNACIGTACSTASTITTSSLAKMPEGTTYLSFTADGLASLSTNQMVGYGKTVRALFVENLVATAALFTCTVNPQVTLYDCGTSAGACTAGRTALANVTLTAANTGTNGTVTTKTLPAGHYWAYEISAGTCSSLSIDGNAGAAQQ